MRANRMKYPKEYKKESKKNIINIYNIKYSTNNLGLSKYYFKNVWWPKSINNRFPLHKIFTRNLHKRRNEN